jgi:DNA-directed RNA polymerase subunit M/transcription elongation factor TFIIS
MEVYNYKVYLQSISTLMSSIRFCDDCKSKLTADDTTGSLLYKCNTCKKVYDSKPEDTLRHTTYVRTSESLGNFNTMIANSAHDLAGYKINKVCKKCNAPFMTRIYVGKDVVPMHTCTCGNVE